MLGPRRVGLGVDDVDARGAEPRHDQVAPLDVRMRRVRAEHRGAGVPAEVVELVPGVGHLDLADELAVGAGGRVDVDDGDGVGPAIAGGVDADDVGQGLGRGRHCRAWRGVKGRVGSPGGHGLSSWLIAPELTRSARRGRRGAPRGPRRWPARRRSPAAAVDRFAASPQLNGRLVSHFDLLSSSQGDSVGGAIHPKRSLRVMQCVARVPLPSPGRPWCPGEQIGRVAGVPVSLRCLARRYAHTRSRSRARIALSRGRNQSTRRCQTRQV